MMSGDLNTILNQQVPSDMENNFHQLPWSVMYHVQARTITSVIWHDDSLACFKHSIAKLEGSGKISSGGDRSTSPPWGRRFNPFKIFRVKGIKNYNYLIESANKLSAINLDEI